MHERERWKSVVATAAVTAVAVAYFLLTWNRTLSTYDGGYLLHNFDKFARGQLPHRDFYDIYGAITYVVGGGLFRLFGTEVLVIRTFVVLLKALMAALIFRIGCRLVPRGFAFLGSILFILYWGDALDLVFNAPYGGHCAHFLALLGILSMIRYVETGKKRWIAGAGFCSGLILLFKVLTGAFVLIGFGLFLSFKEQFSARGQEHGDELVRRDGRRAFISSLVKFAVIIGTAIVFVLYFARFGLDLAYFVIFLLPLVLFLVMMLAGEMSVVRQGRMEGAHSTRPGFRDFIGETLLLGIGPVSLWLLQVLFYYGVGGLEEMLYDTFVLPFAIDYYWPLAEHGLHMILIVAVAGVLSVAILAGRFVNTEGRAGRAILFLVVLAVLLAPLALVIVTGTPILTWRARAIHVFSTSVLLAVFPALVRLDAACRKPLRVVSAQQREDEVPGRSSMSQSSASQNVGDSVPRKDSTDEIRRTLVLSLCYVFGCLFLIMAFPRSDEPHLMLNSTVIFVVAACVLHMLSESGNRVFGEQSRIPGRLWVAAAMSLIVFPLLGACGFFM